MEHLIAPKQCCEDEPCELLIIEDEALIISIVRAALDQFDKGRWHVVDCGSMEEALKLITAWRFECILLDLGLRDSEGMESLNKLTAQLKDGIPIIVYTGSTANNTEQIELEAIKAGASFYLMKTQISSVTLARIIRLSAESYRTSLFWKEHGDRLEAELQVMRENLGKLEPSEPMKKLDESIARLAKIAG